MNQTQAVETKVRMKPWGIEADDPRNRDLWIRNIPGTRLRGALSGLKPVYDQETGRPMVPVDQAANLGPLPHMPGMQLLVNPEKREYAIVDPLYDDKELCAQFSAMIGMNKIHRSDIQGVKPQRGTLGIDEVKTLCREMWQFVESGSAKVCSGQLPTMEEIDALPGYYLRNPGLQTQTFEPRYEKDYDAWVQRLVTS